MANEKDGKDEAAPEVEAPKASAKASKEPKAAAKRSWFLTVDGDAQVNYAGESYYFTEGRNRLTPPAGVDAQDFALHALAATVRLNGKIELA